MKPRKSSSDMVDGKQDNIKQWCTLTRSVVFPGKTFVDQYNLLLFVR